LEHGNLCLNAELRDVIRFYVPAGSKLGDYKGSEVKMISYDELGKTVFEGFVTVRPLGSATMKITYTLPFKLQSGSVLPALYQKQAGTYTIPYTINVNGHTQQQFDFLQDTTVTIKP
jgi:hypothetical protein